MIVIAGTARVKAGARDQMLDAANTMIAASRAEPGCIAYRYGADIADPDLIHFFEIWQDAAALDAHFAAPHMAVFIGQLGSVLDGSPDITRYEVSGSAPLFG